MRFRWGGRCISAHSEGMVRSSRLQDAGCKRESALGFQGFDSQVALAIPLANVVGAGEAEGMLARQLSGCHPTTQAAFAGQCALGPPRPKSEPA